jgi:hypothetical protein
MVATLKDIGKVIKVNTWGKKRDIFDQILNSQVPGLLKGSTMTPSSIAIQRRLGAQIIPGLS